MSGVFISYRRADSAAWSGRVFDRLVARLGDDAVFLDTADIAPGDDFVEAIEEALARVDTVIVVIGPGWLEAADRSGDRRLADPDDHVRREIAAALDHGIRTLPVLVDGAAMPGTRELPEEISALARRNAIVVSAPSFEHDIGVLFAALGDDGAAPPKRTPESGNLPAELTSFIGRSGDLRAVIDRLSEHRLLTLTGPGGSGKTRLALRAAASVAASHRDGAWMVDLAPVRDPSRVAESIGHALGIRLGPDTDATAGLVGFLRERDLLLVLDNYEHVIESASLVPALLEAAAEVKVLVTSRERLHVSGEQLYPVPPLSRPGDPEEVTIGSLQRSDAAALFVDRARAVDPGFELDEAAARDIAAICNALDGLPLAIELAAARVPVLSARALRERLGSRLATLTGGSRDAPGRQRTLRAAIEWSYQMLTVDEATLFARLSVFVGGRSFEAIQWVCGEGLGIDPLDGLESLVGKSLVQRSTTPDGAVRFTLLETLHEYASEQLEAAGEAAVIRRRHCEYFIDLAARAEMGMYGAYDHWVSVLKPEADNIRAALSWAFGGGDPVLGCRLIGHLWRFWIIEDHGRDLGKWQQLALAEAESLDALDRGRLYLALGVSALWRNDLDAKREFTDEALRALQATDVSWLIAVAIGWRALADIGVPERYDEAIALTHRGLDIAREAGNKSIQAHLWNAIGELARVHGDEKEAWDAYEKCRLLSEETGEPHVPSLHNLSFLAVRSGDLDLAEELVHEAFDAGRGSGREDHVASGLTASAGVAAARGDVERAARLFGAARRLYERLGIVALAADQVEHDRAQDRIRSRLSPAEIDALEREGEAMSLQQAVHYALDEPA